MLQKVQQNKWLRLGMAAGQQLRRISVAFR